MSEDIIKVTYTATMLIRQGDLEQLDRESGIVGSEDFYSLTYDGPAIGGFTEMDREVVPPTDVEAVLIEIGNDGTFFTDEEDWA
jgi:hypothetical protein